MKLIATIYTNKRMLQSVSLDQELGSYSFWAEGRPKLFSIGPALLKVGSSVLSMGHYSTSCELIQTHVKDRYILFFLFSQHTILRIFNMFINM